MATPNVTQANLNIQRRTANLQRYTKGDIITAVIKAAQIVAEGMVWRYESNWKSTEYVSRARP